MTRRTFKNNALGPQTREDKRRSEAGDTLVEILITIAVLGIAATALLLAFATSIAGSGAHRNAVTMDTQLRAASAEVTSLIQQQPSATFAACSGAAQVNQSGITLPNPAVPTAQNPNPANPYSATITAVQFWNTTTNSFASAVSPPTTCPSGVTGGGPQLLTVQVTFAGGSSSTNSNITTVVDNPIPPGTVSNCNGSPSTQLAWVAQPGNGNAGTSLFPAPTVQLESATGCPEQNDASSISLTVSSGPGSLKNCVSVLGAGETTFQSCTLSTPGTYQLTASTREGNTTITSYPSNAFTIAQGFPVKLVFTTQPGNGTGGSLLSTQPRVTIEDNSGNTVLGDNSEITLAIQNNPGNGTLTGCSAQASSGVAILTNCAIDKIGTGYTLSATDATDGLTSATPSSAFNITPGQPSQLSFTTSPGTTVGGDKFGTQPVVTLLDAGGNTATVAPGSTDTIALAIGTNGGGSGGTSGAGTLSGCSEKTTAGVATFSGCLINNPGNGYTLVATDSTNSGVQSATSNPFNIVTPALTAFSVTAPTTATAGTQFNVTIQALDQSGFAFPLTGSKAMTFSGPSSSPSGTAPVYPATVTFNASGSGTAAIKLFDAQTTTLTASQGGVSGTSGNITVSGLTTVSAFSVANPGTQSAGTAFNASVTAVDAYGNAVNSYTGFKTLTFSGPQNSPNGKAPTYPGFVQFTAGVGTPSITLYDAQATTTLTAAATGGLTGTSTAFTVTGSTTAGSFTVANPGPQTAGQPFAVTINAGDPYGNPTSAYSGTQTLTFSGPSSSPNGTAPSYPATVFFSAGVATASPVTLFDAQTTSLRVTQGAATGTTTNFVVSGTGTTTAFSLSTPSPTAGTSFSETLTQVDNYGNAAASFTGSQPVTFSNPANAPNGNAPTYPGAVTFNANGVGTATPITLYDAQTTNLQATMSLVVGTSANFTVSPAAAANLNVSGFPTPTGAGAAHSVTVAANDTYGNVASGYRGRVAFTSSDSAATLPSNYTFVAGDNGSHTFTNGVTLKTLGTQSIKATDTANSAITGTEGNITVTAGAPTHLVITSAPFSTQASTTASQPFTATLEDQFNNVTSSTSAITVNVSGTSTGDTFAATSGGSGVSSVTLPANQQSVTVFYGDTVAGTPTITAAASGLSSGTQVETVTAGSATQLNITSAPFTVAAGTTANQAFTVTLQDQFNNTTTKTTATTVNLSSTSTGAKFAATSGGNGTTSVTLPANQQSVNAYYADSTAGAPTITVAATGLSSGTQVETVNGGTATKLVITSSPFTVAAGTTANQPFTVTLEDAFNNATTKTTSTTVAVSGTSTGDKFASTSGGFAVANVTIPANQQSVVVYYADTVAGTPTITAASGTLTSGTQAESVTAGAASQLSITSQAFSITASTTANQAFTVTMQDQFNNATTKTTATTVNLSSTSTGAKFAATSGGAGTTSVTLPANQQSVTAYYADTVAGTPTITAAATGLTSDTQVETVGGGTATKLVVTSAPFSVTAGTTANQPFTVTLQDQFNNSTTKTTATTVSLSSTSSGAKFAATSGGAGTTNATLLANQQSVTAYYADTVAGTPTITAAATGLTSGTQGENVNPATAATLTVSGFPTPTAAGAAHSVTVAVFDAFGNQATGYRGTIGFTSPDTQAVLPTNYTFVAGDGGAHTFTNGVTLKTSGNQSIKATDTTNSGITGTESNITVTAGTGTHLAVTSAPFTVAASTTANQPFIVTLEDAFNNATTSASATTVNVSGTSTGDKFAATSGGGAVASVSLPASTPGVTVYYADTVAGTPTITAAAGSLTSGTQVETVTGAAASKLVITSAPFSVAASATANQPFTVTLEDSFGNATSSGANTTVNVSGTSTGDKFAASSGGTAVTSVTLLANQSSVTAYYADTVAGTPTITVASGTLTSGTQAETVTAGAATKLGISSAPFSVAAGTTANQPFTITLQDAFNNATTKTTSTTVNVSGTSTGDKFAASSGGTAVTSVTLLANQSSVTAYYADTVAGTPTITVASGTLTSGTQAETVTAGAATKLGISSAPFSVAAGTTANQPFTITLQDAFNNATTKTTSTTVNVSGTSTGDKFAASSGGTAVTSVTLLANQSSVTVYYADTVAGTPTITAASGTLTSGTQAETVNAGSASQLAITSAPFSVTAGTTANQAFTATLEDAFNNATTKTTNTTVNVSGTSAGDKFAASSGGNSVTSVTLFANQSTVTVYYADTVAGTPTITAVATGLNSGSQAETVNAGSASQLAITSAPFSVTAGTTANQAFTVTPQDAFNNTTTKTTNTTVNVSGTSTGDKFAASSGGTAVTSVTLLANQSSVTVYYADTVAGTPTITAAATGLNSGSQAETVTGGTATKLAIISPSFSAPTSSAAISPITISLEDSFNNVTTRTTAATINLSASPTSGAKFSATQGGTAATSVPLPANTSTVSAYFGDTTAGTPTITAAVTGLTSATQVETIQTMATDLGNTSAATCTFNGGNHHCSSSSVTTTSGLNDLILVSVRGSNTGSTTVSSVTGNSISGASEITSQSVPNGNTNNNTLFAWQATGTGTAGALTVTFNNGTTSATAVSIDVVELGGGASASCGNCNDSGTNTGNSNRNVPVSMSVANAYDGEVAFLGTATSGVSFTAASGFAQLGGSGAMWSSYDDLTAQSSATFTQSASRATWGYIALEINP